MKFNLLLLALFLPFQSWATDDFGASVVKIFVVEREPDYVQPWQMKPQVSLLGSGFVIDGQRIMTNAHLVAQAASIQVRKVGSTEKVQAQIESVACDSDLAILKVGDVDFFKGTRSVKWGGLPHQGDKVSVYGFPEGGDELSVTEGVVSRIGEQRYPLGMRNLLTIQVDAAINPGNSGGPIFSDGRVVGVSFLQKASAKGIGYGVPVPVIERFQNDIKAGAYKGVPELGVTVSSMENSDFRKWCGMKEPTGGVYVNFVEVGSSAWGAIKSGDVLMKLDSLDVASDASILLRGRERLPLEYAVQRRQVGEKVKALVFRLGTTQEVEMVLQAPNPLVDFKIEQKPTYLIYGGLVFQPLTANYFSQKIKKGEFALARFATALMVGKKNPSRSQIVLLNQVLPIEANKGYQEIADMQVERINGQVVGDMKDLVRILSQPKEGYQIIELNDAYGNEGNSTSRIILGAAAAESATKDILVKYGITDDRSEDLKSVAALGTNP